MRDLWFFLQLFKPYRSWLLIGIVLSLLTALSSITLLALSGWFISAAAVAGVLAPDGVAITFNFMQPAAQIRALAIIRTLSRYGERLLTHEATFRVLAEIRCWFFSKMIPLAPGTLAIQRSGDLLSRMTADIDLLDALYLRLLAPIVVALLSAMFVLAVVAMYSVPMVFSLTLMLIVAGGIVPLLFSWVSHPVAAREVRYQAEFKMRQIEILQGIADLQAFQAYCRFKERLLNISTQLITSQAINDKLLALSSAITSLLSQFALLLLVVMAAELVQMQQITGPELAMLLFLFLALIEWIHPVAQGLLTLGKVQQAAWRVRSLAETRPLVNEPESPRSIPQGFDLSLEQLSFQYAENDNWVLRDINLTIPEQAKIAVCGSSGAGKSTLLHLLLRYFDPQRGQLLLNGTDIRRLQSNEVVRQIGFLSQRSHLFSGTIRENLLLGKPGASDSDLLEAVSLAGLSGMLARLPDGLDALVGELGSRVSGGEARRMALARVYLKNAPILLLDEPTEGLDAATEADVLRVLQTFSRDKTLVIVSHREAGLELANQIYHLDEGVLIERSR
jgi:ATP-binding cassette, subfamily C, bacterial CydC